MDDILILSPTRWKLRRAVCRLNQELDRLRLEKHPAKTWIGRIEKGFDVLGCGFYIAAFGPYRWSGSSCELRLPATKREGHGCPDQSLGFDDL